LNRWQRLAARTFIAACFPAAQAQAAPLVAVEDSMAQRVQACTGCHGPQGRAAADGYQPRIAGKPAGYLYHQLLNFRDGRRPYALMTQLLAPLSDSYLRDIAEHFASLDVPYLPTPETTVKREAVEWARGEALVKRGDAALKLPACTQCHGSALMGVQPAIPALLGLPRDYLNAQLGAWRTGARHAMAPDCMAQIAQRLAPTDIAALSLWLSAQPVPSVSKPAASLPAALPQDCGGVTVKITAP
jgi:cytochrome c553